MKHVVIDNEGKEKKFFNELGEMNSEYLFCNLVCDSNYRALKFVGHLKSLRKLTFYGSSIIWKTGSKVNKTYGCI